MGTDAGVVYRKSIGLWGYFGKCRSFRSGTEQLSAAIGNQEQYAFVRRREVCHGSLLVSHRRGTLFAHVKRPVRREFGNLPKPRLADDRRQRSDRLLGTNFIDQYD